MNIAYLDSLPAVENKFREDIDDGEKVVYAAKFGVFGTESGRMLGPECKLTMTDRTVYLNNGRGIWTFAYDEITGVEKINKKMLLIFNESYVLVSLSKPIFYGENGSETLTGFRLYLRGKTETDFLAIMNEVMK